MYSAPYFKSLKDSPCLLISGKLLLYVVTLVSAIIPAVVIYVNDFPPGSVLGGNE